MPSPAAPLIAPTASTNARPDKIARARQARRLRGRRLPGRCSARPHGREAGRGGQRVSSGSGRRAGGWLGLRLLARGPEGEIRREAVGEVEQGLAGREPEALEGGGALRRRSYATSSFLLRHTGPSKAANEGRGRGRGGLPDLRLHDSAERVGKPTPLFTTSTGRATTVVAGVPPDYFTARPARGNRCAVGTSCKRVRGGSRVCARPSPSATHDPHGPLPRLSRTGRSRAGPKAARGGPLGRRPGLKSSAPCRTPSDDKDGADRRGPQHHYSTRRGLRDAAGLPV